MIIVEYSKDGIPINDFEVKDYVKRIINENNDIQIFVSNEIVINFFRVYVREGLISHKDIKFIIDGKESLINKYGILQEFPKNTVWDDSLWRLIAKKL